MTPEHPFDLYDWVERLSAADWLQEVYIFGSRRYVTNTSFGSDIDVPVVPNRNIPISALRSLNDQRYVDAFLLMTDSTAMSTSNETAIPVSHASIEAELDAVLLWSRIGGWATGDDYRILYVIPDRTPTSDSRLAGSITRFTFVRTPEGIRRGC